MVARGHRRGEERSGRGLKGRFAAVHRQRPAIGIGNGEHRHGGLIQRDAARDFIGSQPHVGQAAALKRGDLLVEVRHGLSVGANGRQAIAPGVGEADLHRGAGVFVVAHVGQHAVAIGVEHEALGGQAARARGRAGGQPDVVVGPDGHVEDLQALQLQIQLAVRGHVQRQRDGRVLAHLKLVGLAVPLDVLAGLALHRDFRQALPGPHGGDSLGNLTKRRALQQRPLLLQRREGLVFVHGQDSGHGVAQRQRVSVFIRAVFGLLKAVGRAQGHFLVGDVAAHRPQRLQRRAAIQPDDRVEMHQPGIAHVVHETEQRFGQRAVVDRHGGNLHRRAQIGQLAVAAEGHVRAGEFLRRGKACQQGIFLVGVDHARGEHLAAALLPELAVGRGEIDEQHRRQRRGADRPAPAGTHGAMNPHQRHRAHHRRRREYRVPAAARPAHFRGQRAVDRRRRRQAGEQPCLFLRQVQRRVQPEARQHGRQQRLGIDPALGLVAEAVEHPARGRQQHQQQPRQRHDPQALSAPAPQQRRRAAQQPQRRHHRHRARAPGGDQRQRHLQIGSKGIMQPQAVQRQRARALTMQKAQRGRHEDHRRQRDSQRVPSDGPPRRRRQRAHGMRLAARELAQNRVQQQQHRVDIEEVKSAQRRQAHRQRQQPWPSALKHALQSQQHQRKVDVGIGEHLMADQPRGEQRQAEGVHHARQHRRLPVQLILPRQRHRRQPGQPSAQHHQGQISRLRVGENRRHQHQQRIAEAVVVQARQHVAAIAQRQIEARRRRAMGDGAQRRAHPAADIGHERHMLHPPVHRPDGRPAAAQHALPAGEKKQREQRRIRRDSPQAAAPRFHRQSTPSNAQNSMVSLYPTAVCLSTARPSVRNTFLTISVSGRLNLCAFHSFT